MSAKYRGGEKGIFEIWIRKAKKINIEQCKVEREKLKKDENKSPD